MLVNVTLCLSIFMCAGEILVSLPEQQTNQLRRAERKLCNRCAGCIFLLGDWSPCWFTPNPTNGCFNDVCNERFKIHNSTRATNRCFHDICNEEFKKTNSTRAACWICNERFKSKCKLKERGLYWEHWKYSKHIHHYPSTRSSHLNTFIWNILSSIWS